MNHVQNFDGVHFLAYQASSGGSANHEASPYRTDRDSNFQGRVPFGERPLSWRSPNGETRPVRAIHPTAARPPRFEEAFINWALQWFQPLPRSGRRRRRRRRRNNSPTSDRVRSPRPSLRLNQPGRNSRPRDVSLTRINDTSSTSTRRQRSPRGNARDRSLPPRRTDQPQRPCGCPIHLRVCARCLLWGNVHGPLLHQDRLQTPPPVGRR